MIDSALFGKFDAQVSSMLPRLKTQVPPVKVYMDAGRAVTTDPDVLPSFTTDQSTVCASTIIAPQPMMLTSHAADPTTGSGRCYYRLAPAGVGNFIATTSATGYAAARRLSGAPGIPVSQDRLTVRCEMLMGHSVRHPTAAFSTLP